MHRTALLLIVLAFLACAPSAAVGAADPDGRYQARIVRDGTAVGSSWALRVAGNGRELRRFRLSLSVVCSRGLVPRVERRPVAFGQVKVGARGRFRKVIRPRTGARPDPSERIVVQGTRSGRRVSGRIYYFVDRCVRRVQWRARRVGR